MRRYSLFYFIGQGFSGLWRNGVMSFASITVLVSCLVLMGSFGLLVYNIDYNLNEMSTLNEIAVFVDQDCSDLQVADISNQIRSLANVSEVRHITKAETFEQEKQRLGLDGYTELFDMLEEDKNEVYLDTFIVSYSDNSRVSTLEYQLSHIDGVTKVNCHTEVAQTIEELKNGIILVFTWFLVILFVVSIFVIMNTIKLTVYARRQEISIMRYIGATDWFIVLPFVFQGLIIGLIAGGAAFIVEKYLYNYILNLITADFNIISVILFDTVELPLLIAFLGIGILTGILGSSLSLGKYLKA
ncbi:MAG: ABC transporter permease [Clostridiales bacterium]|nr:ABC transporter permease [Clostridiales bacterium]